MEALDSGSDFNIENLPKIKDKNHILECGKLYLLFDKHAILLPTGYSYWSTEQLEEIRFVIIEWVAHYKKKDEKDIHQNTLKSFMEVKVASNNWVMK